MGSGQPVTFSVPVQPGRGPRRARGEGCRNLITGVEGGDMGWLRAAQGEPWSQLGSQGGQQPGDAEGHEEAA